LRIVAEHGDFSNFGDDLEDFRHKSDILQGHCETVGRDYEEIGRSCHRMSVIGRDDADVRRKLQVAARRRACTAEEFAGEHFVATVDQAVEEMGQFIDAGCVEMILYFYDMGEGDSMELFATEVIPQLR
jgi:alkanesulfonate monooxygenase SsuD/methylene tetrahydromethanopterin reductase-like flavin-dependent oxidoreductase (luciferase family)